MSEPVIDRWMSRDLPFLQHVVPLLDDDPHARVVISQVAEALGMTGEQATAATHALQTDGLIRVYWFGGRREGFIQDVSAEARRRVGVWPNDDAAADRLVAAIQAMADRADLPEDERSRWATIRDTLAQVTRGVVVQVATSVLSGEIPHPH